MFNNRYFPNSYFAPRYFPGVGAEAVSVAVSRGDELPIWIGVPSLIPTLALVGKPTLVPTPIRTPMHHREVARVLLGTLHARIVQERHILHARTILEVVHAQVMRDTFHVRSHTRTTIEHNEQSRLERQHGHSERHFILSGALGMTYAVSIGWTERYTLELETLQETSAAVLISERMRMVRHEYEAVRESFTVRTAHRLTYQPALTPSEAAAIAAVAMAALDEAA